MIKDINVFQQVRSIKTFFFHGKTNALLGQQERNSIQNYEW